MEEKTNIIFKLKNRIRNRISEALNNDYKSGDAIKYLGCSIKECKQHIESLFLDGMSWENHKQYGWHLDHKIPLASASNIEELIKLFHYTNLQPLWWYDNLDKSNKLDWKPKSQK